VKKRWNRREFLTLAGLVAAGALAACTMDRRSPSGPRSTTTPFLPDDTSTPSQTPRVSSTPTRTRTPRATQTPTYSYAQLKNSISDKERAFLASHEVHQGDKGRSIILMTYDDGGMQSAIEKILAAYAAIGAHTTFFINGWWMVARPDLVEEMIDQGHVVGCHGYEHVAYNTLSESAIHQDIEKFLSAADGLFPGYPFHFIRFPYGNRDQRARDIAASYGLQSVMWTFESGGMQANTYDVIMSKLENGAICLSHSTREYDINDVTRILDGILGRGYNLATIADGLSSADRW
jgi:peptidoglycan/xylan/chitin deacetylase (PgdA/CDA1 family)